MRIFGALLLAGCVTSEKILVCRGVLVWKPMIAVLIFLAVCFTSVIFILMQVIYTFDHQDIVIEFENRIVNIVNIPRLERAVRWADNSLISLWLSLSRAHAPFSLPKDKSERWQLQLSAGVCFTSQQTDGFCLWAFAGVENETGRNEQRGVNWGLMQITISVIPCGSRLCHQMKRKSKKRTLSLLIK